MSSEPLSKKDLEYIRDSIGRLSVKDIARDLNKRSTTVAKAIELIGKDFRPERRDRDRLRETLKSKPVYESMKTQLTFDELETFTDEWVDALMQFQEDLLPTEESELRDLLVLNVLKNRILRENLELINSKNRLEAELHAAMDGAKRDPHKIADLKNDIAEIGSLSKYNMKVLKELLERSAKSRENLSASRNQRVKKITDARRNYTEWLKLVSDYENKARVGREMELMKKSMEASEDDLSQPFKYVDKTLDLPIFNHETATNVKFEDT